MCCDTLLSLQHILSLQQVSSLRHVLSLQQVLSLRNVLSLRHVLLLDWSAATRFVSRVTKRAEMPTRFVTHERERHEASYIFNKKTKKNLNHATRANFVVVMAGW